jgi:hypothetical protein
MIIQEDNENKSLKNKESLFEEEVGILLSNGYDPFYKENYLDSDLDIDELLNATPKRKPLKRFEELTKKEIEILLNKPLDPIYKEEHLIWNEWNTNIILNVGVESFRNYISKLSESSFKTDKMGRFPLDVLEINYFEDKNGERTLEQIRKRNEMDDAGNIRIPNTNIELVNYSYCPNCKKVYSFNDLMDYFNKPVTSRSFTNMVEQMRNDTSVCCDTCKKYFIPTMLVVDEKPISEFQFLCRMQTIQAIETFYFKKWKRNVLTRNTKNRINVGNKKYILNDILLSELSEKPTLILNLLQYSPVELRLRMLDGKNIEANDYLFSSVDYFPR